MTQNAETKIRRGKVKAGAAEVAYTATGAGPGLVLVHGAGASKDTNWGPVVERLKDRFTVVAMDLSGSGETEDGGGPIELDNLVEQVVGAARAAGLGTYHLVGYSLGAVVAAEVAARHQWEVESLVLVAGWAKSGPRERLRFGLWRRLLETDRELFARFLLFTGMGPGFFSENTGKSLRQTVRELAPTLAPGTNRQAELGERVNLHPLLSWISAPTLVLGLTHDQMVLPRQTRELAGFIEAARYSEVESGHLAPWEALKALTDAIETFVVEHAGRPVAASR